MVARTMVRFWNLKKKGFFRQGTALLVAAALLFTAIAPPFAAAKGMEAHTLRRALLSTHSEAAQKKAKQLAAELYPPKEGSFYPLFKRFNDQTFWAEAWQKIIYTPFLSEETWKLEIFQKDFISLKHQPFTLEEFKQLTNDKNLLLFTIGASYLYFSHAFSQFLMKQSGLDPITSTLFALILSLPLSLYGINGLSHSMINAFRFARGERTLTKSTPEISKDQALEILEKNGWDFRKSKKAFGMKPRESFYEFFQKIGILEEFKVKLLEELENKNWTIETVAKRFGSSTPLINSFITSFGLERPTIGKDSVLKIFEDNDWDLEKFKEALGMRNSESFYEFFQKIGVLEEFKAKLLEELENKNWAIVPVAKRFGLNASVINNFITSFGLERPTIGKDNALKILEENNWDLGKSKYALGMRNSESFYEFFQKIGILEEFKVKFVEELENKNWTIKSVAKRFGSNAPVINNFITSFGLERPAIEKDNALKILEENNWDLWKSKEKLGMKSKESCYELFQKIGILEEFKAKLLEELENKNWAILPVAKRFGLSTYVINSCPVKFKTKHLKDQMC